jgi:hypothetical protein
MGIGVISSIEYNNTMAQTDFQNGAGIAAEAHVIDDVGFTRKDLSDAVRTLVNDAQVTTIATVGGLVSCNEAIINSTKNFVSLIGWLPPAPFPQPVFGYFKGCVTLNSIGDDQTRLNWITAPANWHIAAANVGLLYDPNTTMATQEVANWSTIGGVAAQALPATAGTANPDKFIADFNSFPVNVTTVIISAAPHFNKHKEQLIHAANRSKLNICYPLGGYANTGGNNKPIHNKAVTIGPDLDGNNANGAYYRLGQMAATVDGGANPGNPINTAPPATNPI